MEKTIIKLGDIEIKKFHQYKKPISMKNININKTVLSNKSSFDKRNVLNISLAKKMLKKLYLYVYCFQK